MLLNIEMLLFLEVEYSRIMFLTKNLEEKGIIIKYGHHPEMVKDADIIVYTAAICKDDPERIAIKNETKKTMNVLNFLV